MKPLPDGVAPYAFFHLFVPSRSAFALWRIRFWANAAFLLFLCSISLQGQSPLPGGAASSGLQTSSSSGLQNASIDCSDPLQAGTSACNEQNSATSVTPTSADSLNFQNPSLPSSPVTTTQRYSDAESLQSRTKAPRPDVTPPAPLTEFQKFIASTSGQVLPIYGANLFKSVPSTFAPLDMSPVPADYPVGPGDELRIRIWGQVNIQSTLRVDRSGDIFLPQVGPVHVAGLPLSALQTHLHKAVERVYRNFNLTVDIGQIRAIQIYISGQAQRPGLYTVSALSTLVDALFVSGGPAPQGSMRHIQLKREEQIVTEFDLYDLLSRGDKSKDVKLQSGDVIFIPSAGSQAAITGSVRVPAIYEVRTGESLSALVGYAGGLTSIASDAKVSIERVDSHSSRYVMEVAYDTNGKTAAIADGDLVRVFSIVPLYRRTVTLRGNTSNQGRFAWHEGMRLSELIPDKESLLTRNYWWHRSQLGLPTTDFEPIKGFSNLHQPANDRLVVLDRSQQLQAAAADTGETHLDIQGPADQRGSSTSLAGATQRSSTTTERTEVKSLAPEIDWDYAVIERINTENLKTVLIPFDLGKLVLNHDASQDLELQAGDVVTVFSAADIQVPQAHQTKSITLEGEFAHAGTYTALPGETLPQLIERAGGLTPNAYLYGSNFTRESTRASQQARIDEYVQSLSMKLQRNNLAMAASPVRNSQDMASATAAQQSEQQLLVNLRQIKATGRIVLDIHSPTAYAVKLPDLPLENGDHFVVPATPSTINVVGAVYNQNAFLYKNTRRAGEYLKLAGGATRDADRKNQYLIRANGEVINGNQGSMIFGADFAKLRVYPGDTIVIPEKSFQPSALRGFLDWSQVFSQMALGAAAISILK